MWYVKFSNSGAIEKEDNFNFIETAIKEAKKWIDKREVSFCSIQRGMDIGTEWLTIKRNNDKIEIKTSKTLIKYKNG